jgi:hypothetical protein
MPETDSRHRHHGCAFAWTTGLVVGATVAACGGSSSSEPSGPREGGVDASVVSEGGPSDSASGADRTGQGESASPVPDGSSPDGATGTSIAGLRLFFSDLVSGPSAGGQDGKGAFVTVWGNGFGASRGSSTVTVGGGAADNYPIWTATKITFQLGAAAATGNIVVHLAGKGDSNGLPFTVRAGNVYFVTSGGSDTHAGSFTSPWQTIAYAKDTIAAGDIAYLGTSAGDTVTQTGSYRYNASLSIDFNDGSNQGTAATPKALVVYPGATATVGQESGVQRGLLVPAITGTFDYWVLAGLTLRGQDEALDFEGTADGWRVVGNDVSCPNGTGLSGCIVGGDGTTPHDLKLYGNVVHDAASNVTTITKYYHGIYLASNDMEIGWNEVRDGKTCRGIQFHDSAGPNLHGLSVHDNIVHGTVCDGINFATVDPSQGTVEAYNNVVYNVGLGPDPSDGSSDYACIYVANITNAGSPGSGNVHLYNNTLYNCGSRGTSAAGAVARAAGPVGIQMDDNLVLSTAGESYLSGDGSAVTGSNNLFFGGGTIPGGLTGTVSSDPMLAAPSMGDFHLQAGSAAIDHGVATPAVIDHEGNPRPQGSAFDVGAYERPQ